MIWIGRIVLVAQTEKMVSQKLLLSNSPAMLSKIRFFPGRKKILITENIKSWRYNLLKEAKEKYGV